MLNKNGKKEITAIAKRTTNFFKTDHWNRMGGGEITRNPPSRMPRRERAEGEGEGEGAVLYDKKKSSLTNNDERAEIKPSPSGARP